MYYVIYFKLYFKLCYFVICIYVFLKIGVVKEENNI